VKTNNQHFNKQQRKLASPARTMILLDRYWLSLTTQLHSTTYNISGDGTGGKWPAGKNLRYKSRMIIYY